MWLGLAEIPGLGYRTDFIITRSQTEEVEQPSVNYHIVKVKREHPSLWLTLEGPRRAVWKENSAVI